jgi:hypothetical protein
MVKLQQQSGDNLYHHQQSSHPAQAEGKAETEC